MLSTSEFHYDGYARLGIMLSDNGTTFVDIEDRYSEDRALVSIYRSGKLVGSLDSHDFDIDESKLDQSIWFTRWLESMASPYGQFVSADNGALALEIRTIDGRRDIIDLETIRVKD